MSGRLRNQIGSTKRARAVPGQYLQRSAQGYQSSSGRRRWHSPGRCCRYLLSSSTPTGGSYNDQTICFRHVCRTMTFEQSARPAPARDSNTSRLNSERLHQWLCARGSNGRAMCCRNGSWRSRFQIGHSCAVVDDTPSNDGVQSEFRICLTQPERLCTSCCKK